MEVGPVPDREVLEPDRELAMGRLDRAERVPWPKWKSSAPLNVPDCWMSGIGVTSGVAEGGEAGDATFAAGVDTAAGVRFAADGAGVGSAAATGGGSSIVVESTKGEPRYHPSGPATTRTASVPTAARPGWRTIGRSQRRRHATTASTAARATSATAIGTRFG